MEAEKGLGLPLVTGGEQGLPFYFPNLTPWSISVVMPVSLQPRFTLLPLMEILGQSHTYV